MSQHYRALTRTYRPQSFDDIVSQGHVSSTLKNAIKQNRLSHAYMFCGPRGVGKTTMARVLARAVNNVDNTIDGEALNQTLNIVEMDAASNRKIDDVRQLKDVIRVPPQSGRFKIFIIDEVHMLTKEAFNALLKTLEEPPPHAIFIFATTEPHKVLPTILSRVQRFDFKRISVDEIVSRLKAICLKEDIQIDEESLLVIAKKADGALRDALGLMDQAIAFCGTNIRHDELLQALNVIGTEQLFDFTGHIINQDSKSGLMLIHRLIRDGADIQEFLVSLTEHFRNLYIARQAENLQLIEATPDTRKRYVQAAAQFSDDDLMRMLHLTSEAQIRIKDVQQPRVHFEILLLKLIHMSRSKDLKQLLNGLDQLKKNSGNPVEPAEPSQKRDSGTPAPQKQSPPDSQKQPQPTPPRREPEPALQSEPEAPQPPPEPDEDFLTVKPSLGFAKGISASNGSTPEPKPEAAPSDSPQSETGTIKTVEQVTELWATFIESVKNDAPQMLYFQMLRVQVQDLRGTELTVSVDNEFAANLMNENQQMLSSMLKRTVGVRLRLKPVVQRTETKKQETISPYERFKELQRKDPNLKKIVELFGAELEY